MGVIRQLKKQGKTSSSPVNGKMMEIWQKAWSQGFTQGAKEQREKDIESAVNLLEGLENIPGIGAKTAWKIQEHVMRQFGGQS